jgi:hypothetical protein
MALCIAFATSACGSDALDTFHITETSTATIAKGSLVEQLAGNIGFGDGFLHMDITSNETLKNKGVKRSQIDSVRLESLRLQITAPASGQTFDFLDKIAFYAEAEGVARKRIAVLDPVPDGVTTLNLVIDPVELAPYVAAPEMALTTEATGKRPNNDTTLKATVGLVVDVNVSGLLD